MSATVNSCKTWQSGINCLSEYFCLSLLPSSRYVSPLSLIVFCFRAIAMPHTGLSDSLQHAQCSTSNNDGSGDVVSRVPES